MIWMKIGRWTYIMNMYAKMSASWSMAFRDKHMNEQAEGQYTICDIMV